MKNSKKIHRTVRRCIGAVAGIIYGILILGMHVQAAVLSIGTLMITAYHTGAYAPAAGEDFTLTMTIQVPDGCYAVKDAMLQLELPNRVYSKNSETRFYLGDLYSGTQIDVSIELGLSENYQDSSVSLPIQLMGKSDHVPISVKDELQIALRPEKKLRIVDFYCPDNVNITWEDGSGNAELVIENCGDYETDMTYEIEGSDILVQTENKGSETLAAGEQKSLTFKLDAGTEGIKNGILRITYQDSLEQEIVEEVPFSFNAQYVEIAVNHNIEIPKEIIQEENVPGWSVIVSAIVGVVSLVVIGVWIYKKVTDRSG